MSTTPAPFVEQLRSIVEDTAEMILSTLQCADKNIKALNFIHGSAEEVRETLKQYDKSATLRYKKYPLVILVTPFITQRGNVGGYYDKVVCNIGIAHHTKKDYKSIERYEKVINGVLIPLYECLLDVIADSGYYAVTTASGIQHTANIRDDIGRKTFLNLEGVAFDYIDAIELTNVELFRQHKNCFIKNSSC